MWRIGEIFPELRKINVIGTNFVYDITQKGFWQENSWPQKVYRYYWNSCRYEYRIG